MKQENLKALEGLSLFCHFAGLITIFLGILVILLDLANSDFRHIQVGLYILASGYTFVKISARLTSITQDEKIESKAFSHF